YLYYHADLPHLHSPPTRRSSDLHALVSSGTTPKLVDNQVDIRVIGYGGMLMESFVAVMAMICATILEPGVYFAINAPAAILGTRSEEHTSELQSRENLVCRLLLE